MARVRVDTRLIEQAQRLGGHRTKKDAAIAALQRYIQWRKQQSVISHFGTFDFDPDYHYKAARRR
jgi:hypothetical protein